MRRSGVTGERVVALFILGILLFSPPFILIFDSPALVANIPLLFFYLFIAWALVIGLMATVIERSEGDEHELDSSAAPSESGPVVDDQEEIT